MSDGMPRKVVLVTRQTRLDELIARHHTLAQAQFYIEHLGADFGDYLTESESYARSLRQTVAALSDWGRYQLLDRRLLPNFVFGDSDIVVALGQDGLVANTLKYLAGQPLIGVNPEPARWDGLLLPFGPEDVAKLLPAVAADCRRCDDVTMAEAVLSDGQRLRAVNDLFIGPKSHTSALYELEYAGHRERQSSSGLIVATGLGSTAWMKSIVGGALAIACAAGLEVAGTGYAPLRRDTDHLLFAVREPFPSRSSSAKLVYGEVDARRPLSIRSRMPDNGVIFSDGIETDFLRFTSGLEARIRIADVRGRLVV